MRVMLDTNILVSAFIFKSKVMNDLIYKLSNEHEIVICSYTIDELKHLMKNKFKVDLKCLDRFLEQFPYNLVYSPMQIENRFLK